MNENKIITNTIQLNLSVEDVIKSDMANLTVNVEMVVQNRTTDEARDDILSGLKNIVNADWDISNLKRFNDSSGLEKWLVLAKIRVNERDLSNLGQKCRSVSRAGLQFKVNDVNYTPTVSEYEDFYLNLRKEIYKRVNQEIAVLSEINNRVYNLAGINFNTSTEDQGEALNPFNVAKYYSGNERAQAPGRPMQAQVMACATASNSGIGSFGGALGGGSDGDDSETDGNEGFSVSQKIKMFANVTLATYFTI